MARDIGTEYDITEELQTIDIPIGDEGVGQTLINDGAAEIFWREKDVTLSTTDIEAASADVLIATPLFFSRLGPGDLIHKAGITIYAIRDTTTQVDSVLRVAPGRLYQSGDVDLATMSSAIGTTTDDVLAGVTLEDDTARTGISLWKRAVNFLITIAGRLVSTNDGVSIADYYDSTTHLEPLWGPTTNASIGASLETLVASTVDTSALTFTNFDLDEAVPGIADLGTSAAGALKRIHEISFTLLAQGTVDIGYDDDGAGTGAVVLRGPYTFGAGGGMNIDFNSDPRGAIEAPEDKHLTVTFTTSGGGGGGRISTGA